MTEQMATFDKSRCVSLDDWASVYPAPCATPDMYEMTGAVFRGMNDEAAAIEYAKKVNAFFLSHGVPHEKRTASVVRGPTSTTRCKFEVVDATCGYSRVWTPRKDECPPTS